MQKISPLRSSIEAFNKFKALRANKADKAQKTENTVQTNPFGITFKGNMIQMDVFEKTQKADKAIDSLKKMQVTKVKVKRNNSLIIVNIGEIVVGDIIYLESGDFYLVV